MSQTPRRPRFSIKWLLKPSAACGARPVLAVLFLVFLFLLAFLLAAIPMNAYISADAKHFAPASMQKAVAEMDTQYREVKGLDEAGLGSKHTYIDLNGLLANWMGQREINNIIKLNNGYLVPNYPQSTEKSLQSTADSYERVYQCANDLGIPFLFVLTPCKMSEYDDQLPAGVHNYSNENMDRFLKIIAEKGMPYLDLREEIHRDGLNQYDYFYRTDHHWKPEAGFYAYGKIMQYFSAMWGVEPDAVVSDYSNYAVDTYPQWHLGSEGKRAGRYYAVADDFQVLYPKFETSLASQEASGNFQEVLLDRSPLQSIDYANWETYDTVYGKSLEGNFVNNSAYPVIDKKLFVVADSQGKVVNPFLILSFKEVVGIGKIHLDVQQIVQEKPDAVIAILFGPHVEELPPF